MKQPAAEAFDQVFVVGLMRVVDVQRALQFWDEQSDSIVVAIRGSVVAQEIRRARNSDVVGGNPRRWSSNRESQPNYNWWHNFIAFKI